MITDEELKETELRRNNAQEVLQKASIKGRTMNLEMIL
jgi:hypothetical protein